MSIQHTQAIIARGKANSYAKQYGANSQVARAAEAAARRAEAAAKVATPPPILRRSRVQRTIEDVKVQCPRCGGHLTGAEIRSLNASVSGQLGLGLRKPRKLGQQ